MKVYRLEEMTAGWFVGDFEPSIIKTSDVEVAVKSYIAGTKEKKHLHKIATEITVVIRGKVRMMNREFCDGDIIVLNPGEATSFEAIKDSVCAVVKYPGASNDKYIVEEAQEYA